LNQFSKFRKIFRENVFKGRNAFYFSQLQVSGYIRDGFAREREGGAGLGLIAR
jgi:hypothetical protein